LIERRRRESRAATAFSAHKFSRNNETVSFNVANYRNITSISSTANNNNVSSFLSNLSPRQEVKLEQNILAAISNEENGVMDPILKSNIRSLGWIQSIEVSKNAPIAYIGGDHGTANTRDGSSLNINLRLPTMMHPHVDDIRQQIQSIVAQIISEMEHDQNKANNSIIQEIDASTDTVTSSSAVHVNISASKPAPFVRNIEEQDALIKKLGPGLSNVRHFVAVYSCKGGVGKSTVAVNLAYELSRLGGRVGLLDVDVYGPSLPVLVEPDDPEVRQSTIGPGVVKPIEHKGVKLLSLGFVSPTSGVPGSGKGGGAAVMRGPMAGRVVTQLLKGTEWGDLDVLVIDMPPGTGDVQLTICQDLELSGAVSVTTPSKLAAADAAKGIEMFTSLGVPTLAIVENMSYFDCEGGNRHYPFGKSIKASTDMLREADSSLSEANIFQFPISSKTNEANDNGVPLCLDRPEDASTELDLFHQLSTTVAKELFLLEHGRSSAVSDESSVQIGSEIFNVASLQLTVDNDRKSFLVRLFSDSGATQVQIEGDKLRTWHPKLGEAMEVEDSESAEDSMVTHTSGKGCGSHSHGKESPRLFPCKIEKKGRYGYSVEWADQAAIIYSMYSLARAAGGVPHN